MIYVEPFPGVRPYHGVLGGKYDMGESVSVSWFVAGILWFSFLTLGL